MHSRRAASFLMGAWLAGTLLVWLVTGQSVVGVQRVLNHPPSVASEAIRTEARLASRELLEFQALELNRRIVDRWLLMQIGLGAALLTVSVVTARRSSFVVAGAALMTLLVAAMFFWLTPALHAAGRQLDFASSGGAEAARETFHSVQMWQRLLEIVKTAIGLAVTLRLLVDARQWRRSGRA